MTREEAIQRLKANRDAMYFPETIEALDMAIEALQTLEAVERIKTEVLPQTDLLRCKDCRWYENRYGEVCHNPRYGDGHANYSPPYVDEEYFCKDGERREP